LKQEARERSRPGRRAGAQANNEESQGTGQVPPKPPSGPPKPPRGPVVKSRGGPGLTLQGLIDQYVKKEEAKKQQEESSKQSNQASNIIDSKSPTATPKPQRSSSQKGMSLNSRTISRESAQRLDPVDKKAESSRAGSGHEQKRSVDARDLNKSSRKDLKDDSDHDEESNQLSKEEKIVAGSIVKIQSFIRMVICRTKYLEM
jgi:hypothetical protein